MFQEVIDNIWFIQGKNNGRYVFSNSLFINDEKKLLIDTGVGRSVIKKLIQRFGQPEIILYSHGHEDHIPEKKSFSTNNRYIHEKDLLMAISKNELFRIYGLENTAEMGALMDAFFSSMNYEPLLKSELKLFNNNQIFDLGKYRLKVIHSPGHSDGHCCFELLSEGLIFSGDIDLSRFGPWYGALNSDIKAFSDSINDLIKKNPKILITSHKGIFQGNDVLENLEMYLNRISEREESILNFIGNGKTLKEIVDSTLIYRKFPEPKEFFLPAERIMVEKHLEILINKGKIFRENGKFKMN
ncbi:MAG: MBL fold metallo-hydrolase [Candidatus Helarchaeota archaeon]